MRFATERASRRSVLKAELTFDPLCSNESTYTLRNFEKPKI